MVKAAVMTGANANMPALSVRQVTKRFSGLTAVDAVSFDLHKHEILGVIGPNGSGKSTLLNLVSGALSATSGEIVLDGETVSRYPAQAIARRGLSRTFQIVRLLPSLTILQNVAAGGVFGHARSWGPDLADGAGDVLAQVGFEKQLDAPVDTLTYIDQKRVELARALISDPKVLLLDEWLAGLNPTELKTGIALIEALRAEGRTIIIVEHVMHAIRSLCERCVVMNSGVKIAEGAPEEVLADHAVIEAYLGDSDA